MSQTTDVRITLDVLRLLFQNARAWWYHQKLREQGRVEEAHAREKQSVREYAVCIGEATVLHVGYEGRWTLYRRDGGGLSGRGGLTDWFVLAALRAGVPAFDTDTVLEDNLAALLRGPFPGEDPLGALRHARSLGARVYNDETAYAPATDTD
jgi:hypothetical protein